MKNSIGRLDKIGILNLCFIIFEVFLVLAIHQIYSSPKTDVLGAPLLLPNGGRSLQIQLFALMQVVLIPIWMNINNLRFGKFTAKANSDLIAPWIRSHNISFFSSYLIELLLLMYLGVLLLYQNTNNALSHDLRIQIAVPALLISIFLTLRKIQIFSETAYRTGFIYKLGVVLSFGLFGFTFYVKFRLVNSHIAYSSIIIAAILLGGLIVHSVIQTKSPKLNYSTLRLKNLYFSIPVFCFILFSSIPGKLNLHGFESYSYANTHLFMRGYLPWKDFSVEHGLWEDLFRPLLGSLIANDSIWGSMGGVVSIIRPLEFTLFGICLYILNSSITLTSAILSFSYLLERNLGLSVLTMPRILPILIISIALKIYLGQPSMKGVFSLGLISSIAILWTPEGIYPVSAITLILFLVSIFSKWKKYRIEHFIGLISCLVVSIFLPLYSFGLFSEWFLSSTKNASGYLMAWGGPIQFNLGFVFLLLFITVPVVCLVLIGLGVKELRIPKSEGSCELAWLIPIFFSCYAYFIKFLGWPDWHLKQAASLFLIGTFFLVSMLAKEKVKHYKFYLAFIALVLILPINESSIQSQDQNLQANSHKDAPYDQYTANYVSRIGLVIDGFGDLLGSPSKTKVLDFGNEPVSWYGVGGFKPSGGITNVLGLFSGESQKKVVKELEAHPPDAVIWGGEFGYWNWPFNGNWMKQYLISDYILTNYNPVKSIGNYTLMLKRNQTQSDADSLINLSSLSCDWLGGAERFVLPVKTEMGKRINVQEGVNQNAKNGRQTFLLSSEDSPKGIFVKSDRPVSVILKRETATGEIRFNLLNSNRLSQVWLGGCPLYRLAIRDTSWEIILQPSNAKVEVYSVAESSR